MLAAPVGFTLASLVAVAFAQGPRAPVNLDFEADELGSPTGGWFAPPVLSESYRVELVVENAKDGKRCALIASREARKPDHFGNLMQSFDARRYRGNRVRFRAAVRAEVEGPGSRAQLWLRVDRKGGQPGVFDNMADRPITGPEWREYEITGDVADDAVAISIGCMLFGAGKVWFDAASFDVAGPSGEGDEPARSLEGRALDNLVAFTRLLGYVRHFHPSDGAAALDWNAFAIDGVRAVEAASSAVELAGTLEDLFRPSAPTVQVFPTGKRPAPPAGLSPPKEAAALEVTAWRHIGFGGGL